MTKTKSRLSLALRKKDRTLLLLLTDCSNCSRAMQKKLSSWLGKRPYPVKSTKRHMYRVSFSPPGIRTTRYTPRMPGSSASITKGGISATMMNLSDLWKHFRLLTDMTTLSEKDKEFLQMLLTGEYQKRTQKRIEYLMRMSGIRRIKLMSDFDWKFNPKVPRDKIMEFMNTDWLKRPCNVVIMGPAGVGKTDIATSLCHEALTKGHQTMFLSLFDLAGKMAKAKTLYSFVEYYSKVPVLCLDELGYAMLTKEQADCIFQIISKRTEIGTTIVTTNLLPSQWGKIFDSVTASAILDRLSLNGHFFTFEGRSYRNRQ